jgi:hypothetical protein
MVVGRDIFGALPYDGEGWRTMTSAREWGSLEVGDYVRAEGHSFFVTDVQGDAVTVTECNVEEDPCVILWDVRYALSGDGRSVRRHCAQGLSAGQAIESVARAGMGTQSAALQ